MEMNNKLRILHVVYCCCVVYFCISYYFKMYVIYICQNCISHPNNYQSYIANVKRQIYHCACPHLLLADSDHKLIQIFSFISREPLQKYLFINVIDSNTNTNWKIVVELQKLLDQHNELIPLFRSATGGMSTVYIVYNVVIKADKPPVGRHERQYNTPTINKWRRESSVPIAQCTIISVLQ